MIYRPISSENTPARTVWAPSVLPARKKQFQIFLSSVWAWRIKRRVV